MRLPEVGAISRAQPARSRKTWTGSGTGQAGVQARRGRRASNASAIPRALPATDRSRIALGEGLISFSRGGEFDRRRALRHAAVRRITTNERMPECWRSDAAGAL